MKNFCGGGGDVTFEGHVHIKNRVAKVDEDGHVLVRSFTGSPDIERQISRYLRGSVVTVLVLVGMSSIGHVIAQADDDPGEIFQSLLIQMVGEYSQGLVKRRVLQFVDENNETLLLVGTEDMPYGHSMSLYDPEGNMFFRVLPGALNLRYAQDKGGGSFLWAGPGFSGVGSASELQVIAPDLKRSQGPAVSLNAGTTGAGFIRLSDPKSGEERTLRP